MRIALITRDPENPSSRRITAAAQERGHQIQALDPLDCSLVLDAQRTGPHRAGQALNRIDAVIPRLGPQLQSFGAALVRQFEIAGAPSLNTASAIAIAGDKVRAHQELLAHAIATPPTACALSPVPTDNLLEAVGGPPVVVKLLASSQGRGVMLAETSAAAAAVIDALRNVDADFLVQAYVSEARGQDIRAFVIGDQVVAAMRRRAADGDFRANLHRGGVAEAIALSEVERVIAVKAAKAIGLSVAGVDLLQTEQGPVVLEVNASPGLHGIEEATGQNLAAAIIACMEDKARAVTKITAAAIEATG